MSKLALCCKITAVTAITIICLGVMIYGVVASVNCELSYDSYERCRNRIFGEGKTTCVSVVTPGFRQCMRDCSGNGGWNSRSQLDSCNSSCKNKCKRVALPIAIVPAGVLLGLVLLCYCMFRSPKSKKHAAAVPMAPVAQPPASEAIYVQQNAAPYPPPGQYEGYPPAATNAGYPPAPYGQPGAPPMNYYPAKEVPQDHLPASDQNVQMTHNGYNGYHDGAAVPGPNKPPY